MALELTSRSGLEGTSSTFGELAGNFTGATADMSVVAATADEQIASSLANLSGAVSAFSELVLDAKDTTVATDDQSAGRISDAVPPYPLAKATRPTTSFRSAPVVGAVSPMPPSYNEVTSWRPEVMAQIAFGVVRLQAHLEVEAPKAGNPPVLNLKLSDWRGNARDAADTRAESLTRWIRNTADEFGDVAEVLQTGATIVRNAITALESRTTLADSRGLHPRPREPWVRDQLRSGSCTGRRPVRRRGSVRAPVRIVEPRHSGGRHRDGHP